MSPEASRPARKLVAIITGASAGLGSAIARGLARREDVRGLALTARRLDRLEELARELRASNPSLEIEAVAADLASPGGPEHVVNRIAQRFGAIDVLVNNAGMGLPTLFADGMPGHLEQQVAINFTTPLMLTRHALPYLISRRGTIINIGSAITCVPNSGLGAYGATKAGLAYWSEALRRELHGTGVKVCLVEPGPIGTEFSTALERLVPEGDETNPAVGSVRPWMTADVDDVARRVVCLIDHPRRRLSVLRRFVWPFRLIGAVCRCFPVLGDLLVVRLYRVTLDPTRGPRE
jgi:short-subunit dehydrogenase